MGTILASAILSKVSIDLNDTSNVRWPQSELLAWLNDGQRNAAVLKPSCSTEVQAVLLTAGKTKQTIPSTAVSLLDSICNMGADGITPGTVVQMAERTTLDRTVPTWHSDANALGYIVHVIPSTDGSTFYVYPKAPATSWYIECVFAVSPAEVATVGSAITIDDIYSPALGFYVLARAYGKNKSDAASVALSTGYFAQFAASLGLAPAQG